MQSFWNVPVKIEIEYFCKGIIIVLSNISGQIANCPTNDPTVQKKPSWELITSACIIHTLISYCGIHLMEKYFQTKLF